MSIIHTTEPFSRCWTCLCVVLYCVVQARTLQPHAETLSTEAGKLQEPLVDEALDLKLIFHSSLHCSFNCSIGSH